LPDSTVLAAVITVVGVFGSALLIYYLTSRKKGKKPKQPEITSKTIINERLALSSGDAHFYEFLGKLTTKDLFSLHIKSTEPISFYILNSRNYKLANANKDFRASETRENFRETASELDFPRKDNYSLMLENNGKQDAEVEIRVEDKSNNN